MGKQTLAAPQKFGNKGSQPPFAYAKILDGASAAKPTLVFRL